jgi:hypothetical protein
MIGMGLASGADGTSELLPAVYDAVDGVALICGDGASFVAAVRVLVLVLELLHPWAGLRPMKALQQWRLSFASKVGVCASACRIRVLLPG